MLKKTFCCRSNLQEPETYTALDYEKIKYEMANAEVRRKVLLLQAIRWVWLHLLIHLLIRYILFRYIHCNITIMNTFMVIFKSFVDTLAIYYGYIYCY